MLRIKQMSLSSRGSGGGYAAALLPLRQVLTFAKLLALVAKEGRASSVGAPMNLRSAPEAAGL
jgi:hypothetical protein